MSQRLQVFISSKMQELAQERQSIRDALNELEVDAWVFEANAGSRSQSIRQTYLEEIDRSDLYVGLFWKGYGEYTIDEFEYAREAGKACLIYEKRTDIENQRDAQLQTFLDRLNTVETGLTIRWFNEPEELAEFIKQDVAVWQANIVRKYIAESDSDRKLDVLLFKKAGGNRYKPSKFIGRHQLIKVITTHINNRRHIQLCGLGGSGKTALAAMLSDNHLTAGNGSILWLETKHETAGAIFDAFITSFATESEKQTFSNLGVDAAIEPVRNLLEQTGATLLVFDNVWNGEALGIILRAIPPEMSVLVTARESFPIPALIEITVGNLLPQDAYDLLCFYAEGKQFSLEEAQKLLEMLGNHAYALQIAGARLRSSASLTPNQLSELIAQSPDAVPMPGIAPQGRESVRKLLEFSYNALSKDSQKVLLAFGALFTRVASSKLLTTISELDDFSVGLELLELMRCHLVLQIDENTYEIHDLTFSFSQAKFAQLGGNVLESAARIEAYTEDHAHDYELLRADLGNILGAAGILGGESRVRIMSFLTIGGYPAPDGRGFLNSYGHTLPFVDRLDQAIATALEIGSSMDEVCHQLLSKRGNIAFERGAYQEAAGHYQEALNLTGDEDRIVILTAVLGKAFSFCDHQSKASQHFEQAYLLATEMDDDFLFSFVLEQESLAASHLRDYERVLFLATKQVEINEHLLEDERSPENLDAYFFSLLNLGSAQRDTGKKDIERLRIAKLTHLQAMEIANELQDDILKNYALSALAEDEHYLGNRTQAISYFQEARQNWLTLGMDHEYQKDTNFMKKHGYDIDIK